ncbi:MAG: LysR family transcriptional regulator [Rhodospirillales bacterium]|jgi:LysR family transcriptional regulator, glycine cleavage system transcriptional activator|nr:LysR family transcriptional regulator [Rhodospirillales bacterium]MBT4041836.1 LysR family transcriptional regulator [Rhodospirillales bacterium]MBT4626826.1 LysR family transcriptional regulator [Rhodospirillales bacterium]MBT5351627.1 LysR family transcriptional regulator [Rhodospirillales bacterium]MBT5521191.1 LysR family transcriptional regulator [Rhodospirillales bacterium]
MSNNLPPVNWIHAFEASARHLSFTEAAKEMNVTQAAVSQKVKALERHLGRPLFHRLTRSLKLTDTGEAYLPSVRDGFLKLTEGTREVFGSNAAKALTIRVAATIASTWLYKVLPEFQIQHPRIPIRLVTALWPSDRDWDGVDIDLRFGDGQWPGTNLEKLTTETFFPVCAPHLANGKAAPGTVSELSDHMVYQVAGSSGIWTKWLNGLDSQDGAPDVSDIPSTQVDTWVLAAQLAQAGGGLMMCYSTLWENFSGTDELIKPFSHEIETDHACFLVTSSNHKLSPEAEKFMDWVRATIA